MPCKRIKSMQCRYFNYIRITFVPAIDGILPVIFHFLILIPRCHVMAILSKIMYSHIFIFVHVILHHHIKQCYMF